MVNAVLSIAADVLIWGAVVAVIAYMLLEDHVSPPWGD